MILEATATSLETKALYWGEKTMPTPWCSGGASTEDEKCQRYARDSREAINFPAARPGLDFLSFGSCVESTAAPSGNVRWPGLDKALRECVGVLAGWRRRQEPADANQSADPEISTLPQHHPERCRAALFFLETGTARS